MITPKNQSLALIQAKVYRSSKLGSQKLPIQIAFKQNQNTIQPSSYHSVTATCENLKGLIQKTSEQDSNNSFKLPQINKRPIQTDQQNEKTGEKISYDAANTEQLKKIQANPFLRKYVGIASKQKLKRQNSCSFLNIISVKPLFRSSTRMSSGKQGGNITLNQQRSDKLISEKRVEICPSQKYRDSDRIKTISHSQNSQNQQNSISKRTTKIIIKDSLLNSQKKLSLTNKESLKPSPNQKRKSVTILKLEKPRHSPTYSQWCLLLGLLDGVICEKQGGQYYKAFIGKGNNSVLVKNIIKNRPWWTICQQQSQAHLNWTQSRSSKYLQSLKQTSKLLNIKWQNQPFLKMQIFGNCQNYLSQKIKDYVKIGFHKILSNNQKQFLSKSNQNLLLYYPQKLQNLDSNKLKIHNHLQFNWNLSNKKALYYNLKSYYIAIGKNPFDYIPQTYHIQKQGDAQWCNFIKLYEKKSLWIVKPGQNSNRGCGIDVVQTIEQIKDIVKNKSVRPNGKERSHIVQRYLMPFLYNKRKFDIRCYMLVTSIRGNLRCYWFQEGYIRTASKEFTVKNLKNRMIHLTNDAVQKHSQQYGKYESGNKLSFNDFQKYLKNVSADLDFYKQVYPCMMELAADAIRSTHLGIDAKYRQYSFQIFGLDFMIDQNFKTWLIQVNTNPCLQLSCPLLARIIPAMVDNALKIALDPIFPPPKQYTKAKNTSQEIFEGNKFTLIFSSRQQSELQKVLKIQKLDNIIESEDEDGSICEDEQ